MKTKLREISLPSQAEEEDYIVLKRNCYFVATQRIIKIYGWIRVTLFPACKRFSLRVYFMLRLTSLNSINYTQKPTSPLINQPNKSFTNQNVILNKQIIQPPKDKPTNKKRAGPPSSIKHISFHRG